jgi:hypothetical protein
MLLPKVMERQSSALNVHYIFAAIFMLPKHTLCMHY